MRSTNFKYFIQEGFRSFWMNRLMSLASIVIVTACLLLFGIYLVFSVNLTYVGEQMNAQYEIQVYVGKETPERRLSEIELQLRGMSNVESIEFVSKDQRLAEAEADPEILSVYELENPLRDSYRVTMVSLEETDALIALIKEIPEVQKVSHNRELMENILGATKTVNIVSMCLVVFMAGISIFIISNTIQITVFNRRQDINIMKFVGATDWFIRWPFIIEGIIIGIVGAIIAFFSINKIYEALVKWAANGLFEFLQLKTIYEVQNLLAFVLIGTGFLLGAIGSAVAVRKHLHV